MTLHDKYVNAIDNAYAGNVSYLGDGTNTFNLALLDNSHEPNLTGDGSYADLSADEISNTASNSTNYTAGGQTISNVTWSASSRIWTFDGDDVTWSSSTIDAGYAVLYDATPSTDADKKLLTLVDFEGEESSQDGEFTVSWHSDGVFTVNTNP